MPSCGVNTLKAEKVQLRQCGVLVLALGQTDKCLVVLLSARDVGEAAMSAGRYTATKMCELEI